MPIAQLLDMLRQLAPSMQAIILEDDDGASPPKLVWPPSRTQLRQLERRAGMDALACLTILLRYAVAEGDEIAFHLSLVVSRSAHCMRLGAATKFRRSYL